MKNYKFSVTSCYIAFEDKDLWLDLATILIRSEEQQKLTPTVCPVDLYLNLSYWKDENLPGNFSYSYEYWGELKVARKKENMYEITVDEESDYSDVKMIFSEEDLEDFLEFLRKLAIEFGEKRIDKKTMKKDYPELFEKRRR